MTDLNLLLAVNNTGDMSGQSSFDSSSIYTIDYVPNLSAQTYYPKSDSIRIKIIQRNLDNSTDTVQPISTVTIRKYNNTSSWYLSSFDNREDYDDQDIRVSKYINY